ncbi:hypothetical protein CCYA_CCYA12G3234 [Cyanidiococcus yangmingshanensis]|nr:hypothetical protein CCYA_CCYA12G3234 [Cyanidiococcus yangmingshanensis]
METALSVDNASSVTVEVQTATASTEANAASALAPSAVEVESAKGIGQGVNGGAESEPSFSKDSDLPEQGAVSAAVPARLSSEQVLKPSTFALETTKIRFLSVTGKAFTVSFPVYATIRQVKEALVSLRPAELDEQQRALQRPPLSDASELRILYLGAVLDDSDTLLECGFQVGLCQTVHVITRSAADSNTTPESNEARQQSSGVNLVSYLWYARSPSRGRGPDSVTPQSGSRRGHRSASRQAASPRAQASSNHAESGLAQQQGNATPGEATSQPVANERVGCTPCSIM